MMRLMPSMLKSPILVVVIAAAFSQSSFADTLNLNYSASSHDGVAIDYTTVNPTLNVPGATSVSTYSHVLPSLSYTIPGTTFEFYDDYVFTIGNSSLSSITATIDLGQMFDISALNVRLFSWDNKNEQLLGQVTLGSVGSSNLIQAWTYATGMGEVAVIDQQGLAAGTYVLQVRGNVSGLNGGAYVGSLNVAPAPVPLPAALPLLLSSLGVFGGLFGRRRVA